MSCTGRVGVTFAIRPSCLFFPGNERTRSKARFTKCERVGVRLPVCVFSFNRRQWERELAAAAGERRRPTEQPAAAAEDRTGPWASRAWAPWAA